MLYIVAILRANDVPPGRRFFGPGPYYSIIQSCKILRTATGTRFEICQSYSHFAVYFDLFTDSSFARSILLLFMLPTSA